MIRKYPQFYCQMFYLSTPMFRLFVIGVENQELLEAITSAMRALIEKLTDDTSSKVAY